MYIYAWIGLEFSVEAILQQKKSEVTILYIQNYSFKHKIIILYIIALINQSHILLSRMI